MYRRDSEGFQTVYGFHTFDRESFLKKKYRSKLYHLILIYLAVCLCFFFLLLNKLFYKMANRPLLELGLFVYDEPFWRLPSFPPTFLICSLVSAVTSVVSHKEGSRFKNPQGAFLCGVCRFSPCLFRLNNQISEQQNMNGTLEVTWIVLDIHWVLRTYGPF